MVLLQTGFDGNLFKIVGDWPLIAQIFTVLLIVILASTGGLKGIQTFWKFLSRNKNIVKRRVTINNKVDLINHPLFGKLEHFLDHEIRMLNFGDPQRNKLFRMILCKQLEEYNINLYHLATHSSLERLTSAELRTIIFECYNNIVNGYNGKLKESLGAELFSLIMDNEVKGYNAWHEPVLQMVQSGIEDVLDSDLFHNNYEKVYFVLDRYKNSLKAIKMNVENTYRNFNGDLDKVLKKTTF